jgi:predicted nucleic acid-binding protein
MTLVVADAGPVRYLVVLRAVDILARLFDQVVVPEQVMRVELCDPSTPPEVRTWASDPPPWIVVRAPSQSLGPGLHRGEADAIALALELRADAVLLDDAAARRAAAENGLAVTGTLGLLEKGAQLGLLDLDETLQRLLQTNFRIAPEVVRSLRAGHAGRRRP